MNIKNLDYWISYLNDEVRNYRNCLEIDKTQIKQLLEILKEFREQHKNY